MVTRNEVLDVLMRSYKSELDKIKLDIEIALSDPKSIPDHFDYTKDINELLKEAESKQSMVDFLTGLK